MWWLQPLKVQVVVFCAACMVMHYYDYLKNSDHLIYVIIIIIIVNFWAMPLGTSAVLPAQYLNSNSNAYIASYLVLQ